MTRCDSDKYYKREIVNKVYKRDAVYNGGPLNRCHWTGKLTSTINALALDDALAFDGAFALDGALVLDDALARCMVHFQAKHKPIRSNILLYSLRTQTLLQVKLAS